MPTPREIFADVPAGRILDVATGSGGFIHFLLEAVADYAGIVGIDTNERAAAAFAQAFQGNPRIRFEQMDALQMKYPPGSFDTVCISNSLHHFETPGLVLAGMLQVLRPGGRLVVAEMVCDDQAETQQTHVLLHHWWAAVDRVNGVVHRETYPRASLLEMVTGLGLADLLTFDLSELDSDPKDPGILAELAPVFERYQQRAAGHPDLQEQGLALRRRLETVGFHSATTLLAIGVKPA